MAIPAPEQSVVETQEATLAYYDIGSGPAVLVLHGGGPGATAWGNFGRNTGDFDGFRLIVPDLPGFGSSRFNNDEESDEFQVAAARAMAQLLDKLGIDKAHIIGNSLGGGVGMRMAIGHPEKVAKLVLMGPYFRGFGYHLSTPPHEGDAHLMYYYPDPSIDKMRALIKTFVYNPADIPDIESIIQSRYELSLKPEIQQGFGRMAKSAVKAASRGVALEAVSSIAHDTLLVWGRDDKFCHLEFAYHYLSAMKNSELVVFRDTGHWAQVERPKEFAGYVKTFLSR